MYLSTGTSKTINFPFVANGNLMVYRCPHIQAHYGRLFFYQIWTSLFTLPAKILSQFASLCRSWKSTGSCKRLQDKISGSLYAYLNLILKSSVGCSDCLTIIRIIECLNPEAFRRIVKEKQIKFINFFHHKNLKVSQHQNKFNYRISSVIRQSFFLPKQSKILDPSYKTDLDLWDCLGRVKLVL